jgi:hypothetical protein
MSRLSKANFDKRRTRLTRMALCAHCVIGRIGTDFPHLRGVSAQPSSSASHVGMTGAHIYNMMCSQLKQPVTPYTHRSQQDMTHFHLYLFGPPASNARASPSIWGYAKQMRSSPIWP